MPQFDLIDHTDDAVLAEGASVISVEWLNTWIDPASGTEKQSRGSEFWILDQQRIARWDAVVSS